MQNLGLTPIFDKFMGKIEILSIYNFLCRKSVAVCRNSVGKLRLPSPLMAVVLVQSGKQEVKQANDKSLNKVNNKKWVDDFICKTEIIWKKIKRYCYLNNVRHKFCNSFIVSVTGIHHNLVWSRYLYFSFYFDIAVPKTMSFSLSTADKIPPYGRARQSHRTTKSIMFKQRRLSSFRLRQKNIADS